MTPHSLAHRTFQLAADYDFLRLSLYQDKGPRGHAIAIASTGCSTLLRFEDVGYFNCAYAHDEGVAEELDSVERFFKGSPQGCRLVASADTLTDALERACRSRGWQPGEEYAWLATSRPPSPPAPPDRFEIRAPHAHERDLFLRSYLEAFGACVDGWPRALENMRHLFSVPGLHFLFALQGGHPAAIAMMRCVGRTALLCAGATLPAYRGRGCHSALLAARLRLASELGCTSIHSWAVAGGQSHMNMESAGLQTVGTTQCWRFQGRRA
jgi:GNAT superfamily N-acetyltransferase